ncbi:MAG: hypothetical protein CMH49_06310 [Myxococcales bacterium]|nr:hypothetical protein [Myxococcales bacterium]
MKTKLELECFLRSYFRIQTLSKLLALVLFFQCYGMEVTAQPVSKHSKTSYNLNEIERLIDNDQEAQVIIGYELGQVNWSRRTLDTLAVGTHAILSPTGGWGEQDLESLAIKRAGQKFERLSTEIFKQDLELSRCQWAKRSQLFQSQSPHWLSDGSIHLSSTIRFEVYEACSMAALNKEKKLIHQRTQDEMLSQKYQVTLDQNLGEWFLGLDKLLHQNSRQIITLHLKTSGKNFDLNCLGPFPQLLASRSHTRLPDQWTAVRWFWRQADVSYQNLLTRIKPAYDLGEAQCLQQNQVLQLQQPTQASALKEFINQGNALELWIWIDLRN